MFGDHLNFVSKVCLSASSPGLLRIANEEKGACAYAQAPSGVIHGGRQAVLSLYQKRREGIDWACVLSVLAWYLHA